jgi:hypothetical protein
MAEHTVNLCDLAQFTGTETWWRHPLTKTLYTDGVLYVAQSAGAYWLIDAIAFSQYEPAVRAEEFQCWKLKVEADRSATLTCEDGNGNAVHSQKISYTDFPLNAFELWYAGNTLYLPSEH